MPISIPTTGRRRRPILRTAMVLGVALLPLTTLAACGDDDDATSTSETTAAAGSADKGAITIGHQAFGESEVAAHLYGDALAADGYTVDYQSFKDRGAIYAAFESGDIDLVPEYAATAVEFLNKNAGEASPDVDATVTALEAQLAKIGLAAGAASDAVDSNSLVVTSDTADSEGFEKISDLSDDLTLGGPQDCPSNAGCIPALKATYGLDFTKNFQALDPSGPITKSALENGDIDVAVLFSTDATIADKGWVVLEDDKGIFNADNIIPVGTEELVSAAKATLDKVSSKLTTKNVTAINKRYDIDKEDAEVIAKDFAEENGL